MSFLPFCSKVLAGKCGANPDLKPVKVNRDPEQNAMRFLLVCRTRNVLTAHYFIAAPRTFPAPAVFKPVSDALVRELPLSLIYVFKS